jgi:hypothetical protein
MKEEARVWQAFLATRSGTGVSPVDKMATT